MIQHRISIRIKFTCVGVSDKSFPVKYSIKFIIQRPQDDLYMIIEIKYIHYCFINFLSVLYTNEFIEIEFKIFSKTVFLYAVFRNRV